MKRSERSFFDGDDEWESVLHPRYRVSSRMYADIPRSPCDHYAMPVAGLIFMCDNVVRACILRHENLRMPAGPKCINAARVRPGTKLFIFEVGCRLLRGVYEVTSPPQIIRNIPSFPGGKIPYQLYFRTLHNCQPLSEKVFKHAIKDNYYEPHKFHLDLREDQVTKLMSLFSSQEIKTNRKIVPVHTGKSQRVLSLDDFPDANDQALKSSMIKGEDKFLFKDSAICEGVLQQEQIKDNLQIKPEGHLYSCSINRSLSGRAHLTSNDELLNCDLKLGRTETSLICKPGYKQVSGLADSFEDPRQGHPDFFSLEDGELLEPESMQDLHDLHNVTLQLNIDVPLKDHGCGNFYEKSRTLDCKNSQDGTDKYAELQDTAYSPATGKTESLPDQNVYCDLHYKMAKNVHYGPGTQEDIELCSLHPASCPLPSAFSPPVDTANFLKILEHTLTSVSKVTSRPSYFSTPESTQKVASMGGESRSLAQNKGIENHAAYKDNAPVKNKEQNLLTVTLGKRTRITGVSAVSCGGKKKKQSNWLRLSCPSPKQEMIL